MDRYLPNNSLISSPSAGSQRELCLLADKEYPMATGRQLPEDFVMRLSVTALVGVEDF